MAHHYQDVTKSERRERAGEKRRGRMDQGKRVKEQQRLIEARAAAAAKEIEESNAKKRKEKAG